jgi:hypothetical protein
MVEAESSVVEGAVPTAAVFVGAVADMARLGRETLTPESLITIAGRIDQIRIREGRKVRFSLSCSQRLVVGHEIGRLRSNDRMAGSLLASGGRGSSLLVGGGEIDRVNRRVNETRQSE